MAFCSLEMVIRRVAASDFWSLFVSFSSLFCGYGVNLVHRGFPDQFNLHLALLDETEYPRIAIQSEHHHVVVPNRGRRPVQQQIGRGLSSCLSFGRAVNCRSDRFDNKLPGRRLDRFSSLCRPCFVHKPREHLLLRSPPLLFLFSVCIVCSDLVSGQQEHQTCPCLCC